MTARAIAAAPPRRGSAIDWLTTTDHKRIGIMYLVGAFAFFFVGAALAGLMRAELAAPGQQLVDPETYAQSFTLHGTIMMFLFATPAVAGLANYLIPLQIGAADMVFPRLNALSLWLFLSGGLIVLSGYLAQSGPADMGWTGYPPLSELPYSTSTGTDLWIVGLLLTGLSTILGAVNFVATIFARRAPGMSLFRMPMFCWNILVTSVLILYAFPSVTVALILLALDRRFGASFFIPQAGGDPIIWQHLFWFFGHPEVYIVALPFFGILSEVIPVFSRKPLFGYRAMVLSVILIGGLSMSVWAHHMFTTQSVNMPFFSITSFLIAVPTGIKIFNWLATMIGGRLTFPTAMLFSTGFIFLFVIGGVTGVMVASAPVDFHLHDTYFVVAHMHNVLVGGSVTALFGGIYFWFPKMTGRRLSEGLGKAHFWLWSLGFLLTFVPQYQLGAEGMPRRYFDYAATGDWPLLNLLSSAGSVVMAVSLVPFVVAVVAALRRPRDQPADPWGGNSLEWWTSSPPPEHDFQSLPPIRSERPVYDARVAAADAGAPRGAGPSRDAGASHQART
ncbi:MAG TPA: cytochrome c oxidase subunit I [Candidatus Limnocylindrales bacterium]|nr:cytochrome c oxidase subunit I [Candidatus Limnocylindrales bacterium]